MPEAPHYWQLPHGHSLFCDDIRSEVGGKMSFMGVYNGALFPAAPFPTAVRVAFHVSYKEPKSLAPMPVRVVISYAPDEGDVLALFEANLDGEGARSQATFADQVDDDSTCFELFLAGTIHKLDLAGPGRLKVRAYRGDEEVRLGTLRIQAAPPELAVQTPT